MASYFDYHRITLQGQFVFNKVIFFMLNDSGVIRKWVEFYIYI